MEAGDDPTESMTDGEALRRVAPRLDASAFGPGSRIERFEVTRVIGSGGEGIVLEAKDPVLERSVAIKILRPERRAESAPPARLRAGALGRVGPRARR